MHFTLLLGLFFLSACSTSFESSMATSADALSFPTDRNAYPLGSTAGQKTFELRCDPGDEMVGIALNVDESEINAKRFYSKGTGIICKGTRKETKRRWREISGVDISTLFTTDLLCEGENNHIVGLDGTQQAFNYQHIEGINDRLYGDPVGGENSAVLGSLKIRCATQPSSIDTLAYDNGFEHFAATIDVPTATTTVGISVRYTEKIDSINVLWEPTSDAPVIASAGNTATCAHDDGTLAAGCSHSDFNPDQSAGSLHFAHMLPEGVRMTGIVLNTDEYPGKILFSGEDLSVVGQLCDSASHCSFATTYRHKAEVKEWVNGFRVMCPPNHEVSGLCTTTQNYITSDGLLNDPQYAFVVGALQLQCRSMIDNTVTTIPSQRYFGFDSYAPPTPEIISSAPCASIPTDKHALGLFGTKDPTTESRAGGFGKLNQISLIYR